jgi:hypothetical protein
MGTSNRDASQVTVKNRNKSESAYYNDWASKTMLATSAGAVNYAATKPTGAGAEVVAEIRLGCTACTDIAKNGSDPNTAVYPFNPSSGGAGRSF